MSRTRQLGRKGSVAVRVQGPISCSGFEHVTIILDPAKLFTLPAVRSGGWPPPLSPFAQHRIHLNSYLNGARGQLIAASAARELGMTTPEPMRLIDPLLATELVMDHCYNRLFWTGSDSVRARAPRQNRDTYTIYAWGIGVGGSAGVIVDLIRYHSRIRRNSAAAVRFGASPDGHTAEPRRAGAKPLINRDEPY